MVWDKEAEEPTIKVVRMPDGTEHPSVLVPLRLRVARLQYALVRPLWREPLLGTTTSARQLAQLMRTAPFAGYL